MESPPSYCDGVLYANTYAGTTFAINSHNGKLVWRRHIGGFLPSTPAIAGPRLLVSSIAGTETALNRANGKLLWQLRVGAKVESSAVARGEAADFGGPGGHPYAPGGRTGQPRWA